MEAPPQNLRSIRSDRASRREGGLRHRLQRALLTIPSSGFRANIRGLHARAKRSALSVPNASHPDEQSLGPPADIRSPHWCANRRDHCRQPPPKRSPQIQPRGLHPSPRRRRIFSESSSSSSLVSSNNQLNQAYLFLFQDQLDLLLLMNGCSGQDSPVAGRGHFGHFPLNAGLEKKTPEQKLRGLKPDGEGDGGLGAHHPTCHLNSGRWKWFPADGQ